MSRIYVKKGNKWNIFTTVCDDFLFDYWLCFDDLKKWVIGDVVNSKNIELDTLLTDKPIFNYMTYEDLKEEYDLEDKEEDIDIYENIDMDYYD